MSSSSSKTIVFETLAVPFVQTCTSSSVTVVSGGNVIACGYLSVEDGQIMRSGPFIFDSSSGVIMPAAASLMRSRCSATGIVLR